VMLTCGSRRQTANTTAMSAAEIKNREGRPKVIAFTDLASDGLAEFSCGGPLRASSCKSTTPRLYSDDWQQTP
jgi:hypothetical protein